MSWWAAGFYIVGSTTLGSAGANPGPLPSKATLEFARQDNVRYQDLMKQQFKRPVQLRADAARGS